jgi:FAD/FMN-containing dehydrogenase/3-hydroxyacyl-CoA dehydrogenase
MATKPPRIAAVGAGRMGRGIALAFAYAGHAIALIDIKPRTPQAVSELQSDVHDEIKRDLAMLNGVGAIERTDMANVMDLITFVELERAPKALAACELVFEGVPEAIDAKKRCFSFVEAHVPKDCIIASTTSTIDADTLSLLVTEAARFLNVHWLNPAHLMPLVELSPSALTSASVLARAHALLAGIGKVPVVCKASPGYIVPRIQALAMNEAARMVEEGVASAEDIDTAVRVGFGLRFSVLGLLEFIDWGGGDILHHASAFLTKSLDPRFAAPAIIGDNMAKQRRGLRDGVGFYDYDGMDVAAYRNRRLTDFITTLRQRDLMPHRGSVPTATLDALRAIVGTAQVFEAEQIEPRYLLDDTGGPRSRPLGVVRPADTAQVAAILALCNRARQPIVLQGGRTGMTRGGLPCDGELVVSLERLRAIEEIDVEAGTMTVQAGVVLETAQLAAGAAGWQLAVDIGARGSCTIGGMIATNAGGHQVMRYGMMREQVLGLETVLADGTVVSSMNKMLKNNAGYDLKQLFIGSEGTLGVVTRAVLRLRPAITGRHTVLCALNDYTAAVGLLNRLERALPRRLLAFELMWREFYDAACLSIGRTSPWNTPYPLYVLAEADGAQDGGFSAVLADALEDGAIAEVVLAESERDRQRLWSFREAVGAMVAAMPIAEPFDVSIPLSRIGTVVDELRSRLSSAIPGCQPLFFGHIADGNLHLALGLPVESTRATAEAIVYGIIRDAEGSVSAEHGIGTLKREWLSHSRNPDELALMRRLRGTLDPVGILNPGRVL